MNSRNPFEASKYVHYAGRFKDFKPGWWCFSDMVDEGGGHMTMGEVGPFPSCDAAMICATMANEAGVEDISPDMVKAARRAYLERKI